MLVTCRILSRLRGERQSRKWSDTGRCCKRNALGCKGGGKWNERSSLAVVSADTLSFAGRRHRSDSVKGAHTSGTFLSTTESSPTSRMPLALTSTEIICGPWCRFIRARPRFSAATTRRRSHPHWTRCQTSFLRQTNHREGSVEAVCKVVPETHPRRKKTRRG